MSLIIPISSYICSLTNFKWTRQSEALKQSY